MSTLAGLRILRAEVHIPSSGAWFATVQLDSSALPALGAATLTIGDLDLVGGIVRADFDDHPGGALVTATVRGGAGWRLPVSGAGMYASDSGVRLSTVLTDIAAQAGESYAAPADASIGVAYSWQAHDPLAPVHCEDVLDELVRRGYLATWRVAPDGTTRFDAWPNVGAADGRGRLLSRDLSRGRRTVGLDVQVAAFLPGATLEGVAITRTVIREHSGELRAEVYSTVVAEGAAKLPTPLQSLRDVVVGLFPWLPGIVAVAGAKGKGLAIRAAGGLLHLAGGPDDPAVHRVGDAGTLGTFTVVDAPPPPGSPPVSTTITWVMPSGQTVAITLLGLITSQVVVTSPEGAITTFSPGGPAIFEADCKAAKGSQKVTCA